MGYFSDSYGALKLPIESEAQPGFRNAQLGALHAVASHFTLHEDPALVVMPTGSGKTAVLIASAFLLRPQRVLVLTPSRLVRDQISDEFATLATLREICSISEDAPAPSVYQVTSRITTRAEWDELREFDVVVATPYSASPAISQVAEPDEDLFDLVLIDEAHHTPARTWNAVLSAFPSARRVLFTATPFRADQKEIRGRFAYVYPVAHAFEDGIFGKVAFEPVLPADPREADRAIAHRAEELLQEDRTQGLDHRVFVRTDRKTRADELATVYEDETRLQLRVIHSRHSLWWIRKTIKDLRNGDLDGIICVDMLGEGFDFPQLKVAAVHAPHRSLAVTLQFIGRFARTGDARLGTARFVAVPNEIKAETQRLFTAGAIWEELIVGLGDDRIQSEIELRQTLRTFDTTLNLEELTEDLSLYSLRPSHHVKVYRTDGAVDIGAGIALDGPVRVIHREVSDAMSATAFLTIEQTQPRWASDDRFAKTEFDLFVVFHDSEADLLFIAASRRSEAVYQHIASQIAEGGVRRLPLSHLNRVLRGFDDLRFFNLGMRNRTGGASSESYRILTGSSADRAIRPTDGRLFHQGHCFGGSEEGGTIGLSSSSKIWRNASSDIPELLDWCRSLSAEIQSAEVVRTHSGFDYLPVDEEVRSIPAPILTVDWHRSAYKEGLRLIGERFGEPIDLPLYECDWSVVEQDEASAKLALVVREVAASVMFSPTVEPHFAVTQEDADIEVLDQDGALVPLQRYLGTAPPSLYLSDFSRLDGNQLLKSAADQPPLGLINIETWDWEDRGVDIQREFQGDWPSSIHGHLSQVLLDDHSIVFYDHGTGEIADFVTVRELDNEIAVAIWHCKSSGGPIPSARVADAYEVCGQVVKSAHWSDPRRLLGDELPRREIRRQNSRFLNGGADELSRLMDLTAVRQVTVEVVLAQPGISVERMSEDVEELLYGADSHATASGSEMRLICSA